MTFNIGDNNSVSKRVTLQQLIVGLDPDKDKKKIDRITQIFNQYNINANGASSDVLDLNEQVALLNDLRRADADAKGENYDGKVSSKGLKKAGLVGEYKAYRDFVEAYQRLIAEDTNSYDLSFNDETIDGALYTEMSATRKDTLDGVPIIQECSYNDTSGYVELVSSTITYPNRTESFDPKGRLIRQVFDGSSISYRQYNSDAKNARAGIILIRQNDNTQLLKLQEDGTYLNEANNTRYRLNRLGLLDEFTIDDTNRVTAEVWGENTYNYTYEGEDTLPSSVAVNKGTQNEIIYTRKDNLYVLGEDYFEYDAEKRAFTQTEPPKPPEPPIEKQVRPTTRKLIRMLPGWKNQRVKLDAPTIESFNAKFKAEDILTELIARNEDFKEVNLDKDTLLADLIKNNPSVFDANGVIYSNAKWDRLDFPKDLSSYKVQ